MQPWIERSARRTSAESNVRNALEIIEAERPVGGSRSAGLSSRYMEALCLLRLAVRDLERSEGQRK